MTKKTRLIPFDYEKYKAGAKAVFNNLPRLKEEAILGIYDKAEIRTYLIVHTIYGRVEHIYGDSEHLLLEEKLEEKTFYVNVYEDSYQGFYNSIKHAQDHSVLSRIKGHLKITYTDEDLIK